MGDYTKVAFRISEDMRNLIISDILSLGGDRVTGHFLGYLEVAQKLKISASNVSKIWKQHCDTYHCTYDVRSLKRGGDF